MKFGDPGTEPVHEALEARCENSETALLNCPNCRKILPLRDWRSDENTFAAGHLALTLWGAYATALFPDGASPAGSYVRRLFGPNAGDYVASFCHI